MIPTVTLPLINAAVGHRLSLSRQEMHVFGNFRFTTMPRLFASLFGLTVILVFHLIMTAVNTDAWQRIFLFVTLFTVFLIVNAALGAGLPVL